MCSKNSVCSPKGADAADDQRLFDASPVTSTNGQILRFWAFSHVQKTRKLDGRFGSLPTAAFQP